MPDQTPAFLFFLTPFALVWLAFAAVETRAIVATVRADRGRK